MKKLSFLFALLCASMMSWAIDYCHTEMSAGGKTIYLTCQEVSTGNYQLKVECNEAMSGLGGSFCEVNGVGGYQLNAAGHFTLSADGKTITCDIESSTAPRVYTPLYVLIDGEKNFGDISDASWAVCGGSTPEPAEGEKFVAANASINSVYIAPGWAKDAASEATVNYNSSTGTITASILNALGGQWQGQIKLNIGFAYNASKYYDFSIKFHASKAIGGVTLKSNNDNALFFENQSVNLPADEDYVWTKSDVAGVAGDNIFVFDFGWAAAGTDITISEISIIEKDGPSTPPAPVDPNDYTAGGHTIHLDASFVGDIYTLVITSADDMQGLGGSFWNVNGVGADMRTNTGTSSYTVSGDKKTITCQVQSTSAPNIYTPLYVLMPGEVNFGNVTLNWEDRTPITSEYCNYQDPQTIKGGKNIALTWETDGSGNVIITMQNGIGSSSCSFRNGGFEGGIGAFVVSDDDFVTTTPASDYFTAVQVYSGNTYTLTKVADLPANAKIKHVGSGHALAWVLNGNDEYCYPDFIYTYGGTCNQLDAPTNVAIDANNIITFDAVTGADSYTAYVSLSGLEKYHQVVASGDELTFTPLVDGAYDVTVVASGAGKVDSDPSTAFVWNLTAAPVVLGNSEYCEHLMQTGTNTEAAFTWETDGSGNIVITISETLGGAADASHFRGNALALGNFKVGAGKEAGSNYFSHPGTTTGNQLVLTATTAPALGEKIYYNGVVEYATSKDGNAWPTLNFEWTYGTVCSGKAVSATPNNSTMGSAVVKQGDVEVTSVEAGTSVTFIATSADAELYRFVNWTKGGVEVSTEATYVVASVTESMNLVANFEYIRNTYCHAEINSVQNKKLYLTLGSIGGGQYQIKIEGSAEAQLTALTNANYTINWVTTTIEDGDKKMSGQDVPFNNARWAFDASGYGSATAVFGISEGKTWEDVHVWNHAIYFMTAEGEVGYTDFPGRYHIAWNETCSDAEAPAFVKAEGAVIDATSVQLTIQATDNWGGVLTYTIARAGAEPIISNHASGEEFTQDVTGLTAGIQYDFTVTVSDGVNNANTHILVTPEGDNTKPIMGTASLESKTWHSAIINVAATDNKGVTAYYVVEKDADYVAAEGKITVDGLTASTEYTLHIKAKDAAGNISDNQAEVSFTTDAHSLVPTTAAPVPTWPAAQVKAMYSPTYSANCNLGEWGSGTTVQDTEFGKKYTVGPNGDAGGYFGMVNFALNCLMMEKLHFDIWVADDMTIRFVPIWGGAEQGITKNLVGQEWNSIDIDLSVYTGITDWSNIYQMKLDQMLHNFNLWVANAYFYRESAYVDTEAPTNVSASLAATGFYSVKITASAEDNSGAVNFSIKNGDTEVANGAAATGVETIITVNGLTPGTAYNFNVIALDEAGNAAAPVAVAATTKSVPAPAPAPIFSGKNVIPVFTDAMSGGPAEIHSGGWGESTQVEWLNITPNDKVFYAQNFNYAGWHSWGDPFDASAMMFVHLDIYSTGMTQISFTPISSGPKESSYNISLTPNAWTSVDVPLSAYTNVDKSDIFQFKFMNPVGGNEFMADNVYFWQPVANTTPDNGGETGGWATFSCSEKVAVPTGVTAYKAVYEKTATDEVMNLSSIGNVIPAGEGVILKGAAGTAYAFSVTDATPTEDMSDNMLVGCPVRTDITSVLVDNDVFCLRYSEAYSLTGFFLYTGQYVPAGKAYLALPKATPGAGSTTDRGLRFVINDSQVTTAITGAETENTKITKFVENGQLFIRRGDTVYTIQGMRVK